MFILSRLIHRVHTSSIRLLLLLPLSAILLFGAGGCTTNAMKGTPFFSGEYGARTGPAADRINAWPLLYYRDPALSILWPFIEYSDDHFTVRPIFSVNERKSGNPVYSVLWPLTQFDTGSHDNWIFPFFWSSNYRVAFPLYWHEGQPIGKKHGTDTLFPLWWYSRRGTNFSFYAPWPFVHGKRDGSHRSWHIWPLAGGYRFGQGGYYRFQAWPLAHQFKSSGGSRQINTLFPLHYYEKSPAGSLFLSLPWMSWNGSDDQHWQFVLPLLSYRHTAPTESSFISPIWSQYSGDNGRRSWKFLPPLFYASKDHERRTLATLLGGYTADASSKSWVCVPLLTKSSSSKDARESWFLGPLIHSRATPSATSHHVLPLYYAGRDEDGRRFYSLPWSSVSNRNGTSWQLLPPLYYRSADNDGSALITPLWAGGSNSRTASTWHTLLPLYYTRHTPGERLFATLLGGWRTDAQGRHWKIYPLLSWGNRGAQGGEIWAVAPLFHAAWGDRGSSHHVLPLYYWNGIDNVFVSPVAARWKNEDESTTTLVPPLVSWKTAAPRRSDLWLLAALAHFSWGVNAGPWHIFPLYYHNPQTGSSLSPLVCTWRTKDDQQFERIIPPLLSGYARDGDTRDLWALLGLYHNRWSSKGSQSSHLLPLYHWEKDDHFFTPLFGWNRGVDAYTYVLTPLLGVYRGNQRGGWLFPLFDHQSSDKGNEIQSRFLWGTYKKIGTYARSIFFPLYGYSNFGPIDPAPTNKVTVTHRGKDLFCLPTFWYRNEQRVTPDYRRTGQGPDIEHKTEHGFFPLWSYAKKDQQPADSHTVSSSFLLWLYDYKHDAHPDQQKPGGTNDYTRARILWRLYHYERLNDDVSVDVLPAITYDRTAAGYKKVSFLWRFFRYERTPEGARNLDLLFIPLMRKQGATKQ